jgi:hypothetical protein
LALPVYVALALKRVHGQGWPLTALKTVVVGALHLAATLAALVLTTLALMAFAH